MLRTTTLLATLALLLSACTPSFDSMTSHLDYQAPTLAAFYPNDVGTTWTYSNPEGMTLETELVGLRSFEGGTYQARTTTYDDQTRTEYLVFNDEGIHLAGVVEPDHVRSYDPPLPIYPNQHQLQPGFTWSGATTVTETTQPDSEYEVVREWDVTYHHEVSERALLNPAERDVSSTFTHFDAYRVDHESQWTTDDEVAERRNRNSVWFTPFLGEVVTGDGNTLIRTSLHDGFTSLPTFP